MKIAILGSGVIGVTSAWYLSEADHEVVAIDKQECPALETSETLYGIYLLRSVDPNGKRRLTHLMSMST